MLVNAQSLSALFTGFKTAFNQGFNGAPSYYKDLATIVPSETQEEKFGWLGTFPAIREWLGDRQVQSLAAHGYTIANRKFELTLSVDRTHIEDDRYGVFAPLFQELGFSTASHPDELLFNLLADGFTAKGYDGKPFFAADHPLDLNDDAAGTASNVQSGAGPAWFMLDCSRGLKPLIFQQRVPYEFTRIDASSDEHVFMRDAYLYGVRARVNAGFGLWQFAFASKDDLTPANYAAARAAMRGLRGRGGRPMGVRPTHLVVPPALEEAAQQIVAGATKIVEAADGTPVTAVANTWVGSAKVIVSEWLAA